MGWATIKNGELLALAEGEFDVFVTADRNLAFQHNVPKFNLASLGFTPASLATFAHFAWSDFRKAAELAANSRLQIFCRE